MPFVGLMTPRASPQMKVTRPRGDVPGRKTPFYADVTTRSDTLDLLILFQLRFNRFTTRGGDCSRAHTGDALTDIRPRTVSEVIRGRAIWQPLRLVEIGDGSKTTSAAKCCQM